MTRDVVSMAGVGPVSADFSMIKEADQFYIADADWVGILGMAYQSIAAVSETTYHHYSIGLCVCVTMEGVVC